MRLGGYSYGYGYNWRSRYAFIRDMLLQCLCDFGL